MVLGWLRRLRHMFISEGFRVGWHDWFYRISEGEYEWTAALTAHPKDEGLSHPVNPFTIYAYKARDPETGWEGYIFAIYPVGCGESACAEYVHTEAIDEDLPEWLEFVAEIAPLYYNDPERYYEELSEGDMYVLEPEELDRYEFIRPTPSLAEKLVNVIKGKRFVKVRHIPLARR